MSHVRYIDKTREYYRGEGYATPYRWAHFDDVPFTPLARPLAECVVGLVTTSEMVIRGREAELVHVEDDPTRPGYSLPTGTPTTELYSRKAAYDKHATTLDDVDAYLPLTHLRRLIEERRIGGLAPRFHVVHSQYSQRRTLTVDAPRILAELREDRVDVAVLTAVWPVCHQTVSLVARYLEEHGVPTVVFGCARDIVEHCGVPRFVFTDFPLGNPTGRPFDPVSQRHILNLGLDLLERARAARATTQSPYEWSADSSWKDTVLTKEQPFLDAADTQKWLARKAAYKDLKSAGKA